MKDWIEVLTEMPGYASPKSLIYIVPNRMEGETGLDAQKMFGFNRCRELVILNLLKHEYEKARPVGFGRAEDTGDYAEDYGCTAPVYVCTKCGGHFSTYDDEPVFCPVCGVDVRHDPRRERKELAKSLIDLVSNGVCDDCAGCWKRKDASSDDGEKICKQCIDERLVKAGREMLQMLEEQHDTTDTL